MKTVRVVADEKQPSWMVSANQVSGAASRRTSKVEDKPAKPRAAQKSAEKTPAKAPSIPVTDARSRGETPPDQGYPQGIEPQQGFRYQQNPESQQSFGYQQTPEPQQSFGYQQGYEPQPGPGYHPGFDAQPGADHRQVFQAPSNPEPRRSSSSRKPVTKRPAAAKKPAKRTPKRNKRALEQRVQTIRRAAVGTLAALILVALIVVAFIGGGRLLSIKQTLDVGDGVFYPNLFVNDIPLEGYTLDDAASVVTQQVVSLISSWKITLRTQDGRSWAITGADLNMQYNVADQLDQLWAIGHTGSSAMRYEQVKALQETPVMRYTTLTYDMTKVMQILTSIKGEIDTPAVSATRVNDDSKWPPFSYTDDIPGQTLDITGLNEQICAMVDRLESGDVYLTPTPVQAGVTREYLEGQIVELATYDTAIGTSSEPGRFINIRVGTEKFNHLIIKPNESVSFNKVTGLRTYANGYADAPEIAYGEYVTGVGGGICQVSSTLYNAVINAGLEVTKRTAHAHPSNYVPYGLDATVQDNRLDFIFRNNTKSDIYISSEYYQSGRIWHCRFTIHGRPDPNGYTFKLESQVRETIPIPDPTYRQDTEAQYVVYDDEQEQTRKGSEGYVVDVYLVTMDKNGLEISRVLDHTDTYNPTAPIIYVGVTPRETPIPNYLNY